MFAATITAVEERFLLQLARDSITAAVTGNEAPPIAADALTAHLRQPLGAFVTLYQSNGDLRGCIGRMSFDTPLYENVREAAVSSALNDPRFPSVEEDELRSLRIEISVLQEPVAIDGPEEFDENEHGIVMELGVLHGVFLPKVAREYGWDRATTLSMLCRKIGVSEDAWQLPGAKFKVFRAHEFGEPKV